MSYETQQVMVCDGEDRGHHACGKIIPENTPHTTIKITAWSSDMGRPQGIAAYNLMSKVGLNRVLHIHQGCQVPITIVPHIVELADTTKELLEDDD